MEFYHLLDINYSLHSKTINCKRHDKVILIKISVLNRLLERPICLTKNRVKGNEANSLDKLLGFGPARLFNHPNIVTPNRTPSAQSPHLVILLKFLLDM